ncbi:uncharacterized protein RAG0_04200 [Rhynchosporium agropyri]|uniref:Secreted protein n=1 Tax=Rhynchosporium agropyri TaxID=914238 RepID=A0A1E1K837_9HELO|nr:uncharacterized protein RAG0_04200 [Rhynchosporium agropyri]
MFFISSSLALSTFSLVVQLISCRACHLQGSNSRSTGGKSRWTGDCGRCQPDSYSAPR